MCPVSRKAVAKGAAVCTRILFYKMYDKKREAVRVKAVKPHFVAYCCCCTFLLGVHVLRDERTSFVRAACVQQTPCREY